MKSPIRSFASLERNAPCGCGLSAASVLQQNVVGKRSCMATAMLYLFRYTRNGR